MPIYKIYHPIAGMNHQCLRGVYEYYEVCQVEADNLNKVFVIGQNGHSEEYTALGKRSTSVGDIIVDVQEDKHYMIMGVGFQELPATLTNYVDYGIMEEDLSELEYAVQHSEGEYNPYDPEDYEESDDDYQDRLERSWEKYEN